MFAGERHDGVIRAVLLVGREGLSDVVPFVTEHVGVETLHVLVPTNAFDRPEGHRISEAETEEYVRDRDALVRWSRRERTT